MKVLLASEQTAVAKAASERIVRLIRQKPSCILGLATGSSSIGLYQELVKKYKEGVVSFANSTSFNLDEYVGLDASNPQSFRYFMKELLFRHVDFSTQSNHFPSLEKKPEKYDQLIAQSGGIDLQILGIGSNGHIGFNEPGTDFNSFTHIAKLTEQTRRDNSRFFSNLDAVPRHAITMGVGSIMKAREIIILALGMHKADAVAAMVDGEITAEVPASILQQHQSVTTIVDSEAGSYIQEYPHCEYI